MTPCYQPVRSHAARTTNYLVKHRETRSCLTVHGAARPTRFRCRARCPSIYAISGGRVVGADTWRMKVVHCDGDEPFCVTTEFPQPRLSGQCWDNAGAESLRSTFKHEYYNRHTFAAASELVAAVGRWMHFYNTGWDEKGPELGCSPHGRRSRCTVGHRVRSHVRGPAGTNSDWRRLRRRRGCPHECASPPRGR